MRSLTGTPVNDTLTLTNANAEYSYTFPAGTMYAESLARTSVAVRFAYVTGKVATPTEPYETAGIGVPWHTPDDVAMSGPLTVYFACGTAGTVLEIEYWR